MPQCTVHSYGWIQSKEKVDSFVERLNAALSKCEEPSIAEELERLKEEVTSLNMFNGKMEWALTDIESRLNKEIDNFFTQFD